MILQAKHLYKAFYTPAPVEILSNVTIELEEGKSMAITGRSGEGKTTLLHILGTLEEFDRGELLIGGQKVDGNNRFQLRNQKIGFIFQSFNLLEDFTALENVMMPALIGKKFCDIKKAMELLSHVQLEQRAHFPVKYLSGGEKQRVAIARALCNNPDLIFADEPSGNLDHQTANIISDLLFSIVKKEKKGLILVTHDLTLAKRCDHQYELKNGSLGLVSEYTSK